MIPGRCALGLATAMAAVPAAVRAGGAPRAVVVPQVAAAIRCDGELDELAWRSPARTGPFLDDRGETAAPYSEARFLRDDRFLYVALYAADEDVEPGDEFTLELRSPRGHVTLHLGARGALAPAIAGAQHAVDLDGSLGDPSDDDEEWIVEAALPLAAIPFGADGTLDARVTRCDTTKDHVRRCGAWRGRLARR